MRGPIEPAASSLRGVGSGDRLAQRPWPRGVGLTAGVGGIGDGVAITDAPPFVFAAAATCVCAARLRSGRAVGVGPDAGWVGVLVKPGSLAQARSAKDTQVPVRIRRRACMD